VVGGNYRIFSIRPNDDADRRTYFQRVHPEDAALVKQIIERAAQDRKDFWHEYRLVMRMVRSSTSMFVVRALNDESGSTSLLSGDGRHRSKEATTIIFNARDALEKAFEEIKTLKDQLYKENIALRKKSTDIYVR